MPDVPDDALDSGETGRDLSHVDGAGRARMVDVTGKAWTQRRAIARCRVDLGETRSALRTYGNDPARGRAGSAGSLGEVLVAAQVAGIQAAKQTAELVPLCHPLTLSNIDVRFSVEDESIGIEGVAEVVGPTGVEMEALTACAFAALSIMSSLDRRDAGVAVRELELWEKSGGRSGTWLRR